jgi:uncharacterized protein YbcC (UPF0753/DUF2309 family)
LNVLRSGKGVPDLDPLDRALEHVGHLLPAQGPITVFIHHNTLHAFEHVPFEDAVTRGGALFDCEPYLPEARYREELAAGRIRVADLEEGLADLEDGDAMVGALATRRAILRALLVHGVKPASGPALAWLLDETDALDRVRADVSPELRERFLAADPRPEKELVHELWVACLAAVARGRPPERPGRPSSIRHRDLLHDAGGADVDSIVHPVLIRLAAAFLDQGIAHASMPVREQGFYRSFLAIYGAPAIPLLESELRPLRAIVADEARAARTERESIMASLAALGVAPHEWEPFLVRTALALRGWAGMMRQIELRPDRVPVIAPPATLAGFLAVRLLLERTALARAAKDLGYRGELSSLREWLGPRLPRTPSRADSEIAWPLFHVAQLLGVKPARIAALSSSEVRELLAEIDRADELERRRRLHLAYERRFRQTIYDALGSHSPRAHGTPSFQAIFCLDERSESIRRHLEEVEPECESLGAAGFFGVAMYYRGADDVHPRPLCPVVMKPEHEVVEVAFAPTNLAHLRQRIGQLVARWSRGMSIGSLTMFRGTLVTAGLGALATIPLVLRVLFPRIAGRIRDETLELVHAPAGRLALDRRDEAPVLGRVSGFTKDEMADRVARLAGDLGIGQRLAPLVLVLGHGSSSLNNPHESAYDCGACGGSKGGPNARAIAQMANDPEVRAILVARQGIELGESVFVGGEHNTANDEIRFFDTDRIPARARSRFDAAVAALDSARARDAHERSRRFDAIPPWFPARLALAHVEGRADDLAQPRPEYGHSTNALCLVGRRARTRGLFFDRRAFLVSYDPTLDHDGSVLAGLLTAIVPVVVGINLEYYFGRVDPWGYGCGTKLPHNVTALLGVMEGHASDLRTGLPWQTVDMHEPVRLTIVVECEGPKLLRVLESLPAIKRLVDNRWFYCAALDPSSNAVAEIAGGELVGRPVVDSIPVAGGSMSHYRGRSDHLPFARIELGGEPT